MSERKPQGALAEFAGPQELMHAARRMRDAGYRDYDAHSPFPIHGMEDAMGQKRSKLSWIVALFAILAFVFGVWLQGWTSAVDYRIVVAGKPFFSYQAFFPIVFSITVLVSAIVAVVAMIALIRQSFHHPVFHSDRFGKFSDDGFFISVLARDPKFDRDETTRFLAEIGGSNVETLEGD